MMNSGILLLDKPEGLSSARALYPLKKVFAKRKIGHTGTLDPFASGLLVVMVGSATRLAPWFVGLDKEYQAVIRFGEETDTLDPEGSVVRTAPPPDPAKVEKVLFRFVGTIQQTPPVYSAVHIDGKRAYRRARAGETVRMPQRSVTVHDLSVEPLDQFRYRFRIACGSGTYIRSLARDIAYAAGSVASLESLHRVALGPFRNTEALQATSLTGIDAPGASGAPGSTGVSGNAGDAEDTGEPRGVLLPIADALARLGSVERIRVLPEVVPLVRNGIPLTNADLASLRNALEALHKPQSPHESGCRASTVLLVDDTQEAVALCEADTRGWRYRIVFPREKL